VRLNIGGWLAGIRQVQLGEESLCLAWWCSVADDVRHHEIAERFIVVEGRSLRLAADPLCVQLQEAVHKKQSSSLLC
jgi:hypothetical protein